MPARTGVLEIMCNNMVTLEQIWEFQEWQIKFGKQLTKYNVPFECLEMRIIEGYSIDIAMVEPIAEKHGMSVGKFLDSLRAEAKLNK